MARARVPFRNWAYAGCSVCVLGAVVASVRVAPGLLGVLGAGLAILMIAIAVSDARHFIIPDLLVLAALGLGLLQALLVQPGNFLAAIGQFRFCAWPRAWARILEFAQGLQVAPWARGHRTWRCQARGSRRRVVRLVSSYLRGRSRGFGGACDDRDLCYARNGNFGKNAGAVRMFFCSGNMGCMAGGSLRITAILLILASWSLRRPLLKI